MTKQRPILHFDLYVDESGEFLETSNVPAERERVDPKQEFPSLLAGFLVPRGDIKDEAQAIFDACKRIALIRPAEVIKGNLLRGKSLRGFIRQLLREFEQRPDWQMVRIVNQESVAYGDQAAAYTNIFAELILRILQHKSAEHPGMKIYLRVFATRFMRRQSGFKQSTRDSEYTSRINEYLKFLAVRRGLAADSADWMLEELILNPGNTHPGLLIADILSNAGIDDFRKLDFPQPRRRSDVSNALVAAFGDRNWTMTVRELFERVAILVEEYSYGMALIAIAETIGSEVSLAGYDPAFIEKAQERITDLNRRLAHMGARGRDPQLAIVLNWLDQVVGHQRLTQRGYDLAQWLITKVSRPLRQELSREETRETIDWFEFGLHRWALTAANHDGKLFAGAVEVRAMQRLAPSLARQWERAPILFDGLISQAVHLTDAFEFAFVSRDMRLLAASLATQSDLFANYQGGEFPDPIKFDLRGKALGTLLQNEMLRGFATADQVRSVRELSDETIAEFNDPQDQARQFQYRCHLETIAGDYAAALQFLIWSIRKAKTAERDFSHAVVARLLAQESAEDPHWQQEFTISHWLRLGAKLCLTEAPERYDFLRAFRSANIFETYTMTEARIAFPIHNILRFLAVIQASENQFVPALFALGRLHDLDPIGKNEFIMAMILIAGQAEVAALLWESNETLARKLLAGQDTQREGLKQLFERLKAARVGEFSRLAEVVNTWETKIDELLGGDIATEAAQQVLLGIASEVRY